jgi:hypothetical protein
MSTQYDIQFPTVDGTEAAQWCPTGTGEGTHKVVGYQNEAGNILKRAAAYAECLAICDQGGFHDKMLKAVIKEGGKKGIEISGAADMGGLEFFNTIIEQCKGKECLVELAMHAMNKDIDPEEEESKGGSAEVGKVLIAPGEKEMCLCAYVPDDKVHKVQATAWLKAILDKWEIPHSAMLKQTDTWATAHLMCDAEKGQFSLKLKESALQGGINYLREVGAFPEGDESDDDECYANDFEW